MARGRIACSTLQVYERKREYTVNVAPEVQSVELGGEVRAVTGSKFQVSGLESCREESRREEFFDGLSGLSSWTAVSAFSCASVGNGPATGFFARESNR